MDQTTLNFIKEKRWSGDVAQERSGCLACTREVHGFSPNTVRKQTKTQKYISYIVRTFISVTMYSNPAQ